MDSFKAGESSDYKMPPMLRPLALVLALGIVVGCRADRPIEVPVGAFDPLPAGFQRGMNLEPIGGLGGRINLRQLPGALDELVAIGVDHVALIPSFFQERLGDTDLTWRGGRQRVDSDTRAAIRLAHERGLAVLLKPHLWLADTSDGSWRGDINPSASAWPAWRVNYREAVLAYARMAAEEGVAGISLGSELTELALARPEFWRSLAGAVRGEFSGQVTYAANWDREFAEIEWWDALDAIGVDAFWPLVESPQVELTPSSCARRMAQIRRSIGEVATRVDRPVILTELGYKSATGGAYEPWEWHTDEQQPDPELQALIYRCAAEAFGVAATEGWLEGFYVWIWYTNPGWGGLANSDFTPRRKPAQGLLEAWFRANADAAAGEGPETGNQ